jgi:hypothetical protein
MPSIEYRYRSHRVAPKRPYQSLADFRNRTLYFDEQFFEENPNKWPCLECKGVGTIYDPNDPPCPVEGNKMRDRIKCPRCGGCRHIPKEEFAKAYREIINEYLEEKAEYQALVKAKRSGLKKLTKAERDAIASLGI